NTVEGKYFFRQHLVLGQVKALRTSAGIGTPQKIEKCGDMQLFLVVASVRFHQVEEQIIFAAGQRQQSLIGAVKDFVGGLMAEFFQSFEDLLEVVFLAAFFLLLSFIAFLLVRCFLGFGDEFFISPVLVKNRDFQLFHVVARRAAVAFTELYACPALTPFYMWHWATVREAYARMALLSIRAGAFFLSDCPNRNLFRCFAQVMIAQICRA